MISFLSDHIEQKPVSVEVDFSSFFQFMVSIVDHPSLVVSIPIVHSWTKLLASRQSSEIPAMRLIIGPLLEVASRRLIRYEQLPEDSQEPAIIFISEDIETVPERHAFLGNYRRYCFQVVELICYLEPQEALPYVLSTTDRVMNEFQTHSFDPSAYSKSSPTVLQIDARLTTVEAALKGCTTWITHQGKRPQSDEQARNTLETTLESWASTMLTTWESQGGSVEVGNVSNGAAQRQAFEDPMIRQRIMKTAVEFSNRALEKKQSFALKVLEHLLATQLPEMPEYPVYFEAVKDLHVYATGELRRLATRHADYFATFYDQLKAKIEEIAAHRALEEKAQVELPAALFIIMLRANNVEPDLRRQRLLHFVEPLVQAWQNPQLSQDLSNINNFTASMAFDKIVRFLRSLDANRIQDWSATTLSPEGLAIRDEVTERYLQLPLRLSKTLLGVSVDKLSKESQPYRLACELWSPIIPIVLPNLLQLVNYAHRLHNPETWPDLPPEMQGVVTRMLQDRFWQAGISGGTMNDFYATIATTKASLEGFASATRGKIRGIRENCYSIIYSLSRLGDSFYGYEGLPGPLAEALFTSASYLSPHNFSILLDMAKRIVDDCPPSHRASFLVPVLSALFREMDKKNSDEWAVLDRRKSSTVNGDDLTDEMRAESILRQLSYKSVMLVATLLDPLRDQPAEHEQPLHNSAHLNTNYAPAGSLRNFLLSDLTILEPLLLFCAHSMEFRDTRSSAIIVRIVRSIVPHFASSSPSSSSTPTQDSTLR